MIERLTNEFSDGYRVASTFTREFYPLDKNDLLLGDWQKAEEKYGITYKEVSRVSFFNDKSLDGLVYSVGAFSGASVEFTKRELFIASVNFSEGFFDSHELGNKLSPSFYAGIVSRKVARTIIRAMAYKRKFDRKRVK
jgi:hypothetical protein